MCDLPCAVECPVLDREIHVFSVRFRLRLDIFKNSWQHCQIEVRNSVLGAHSGFHGDTCKKMPQIVRFQLLFASRHVSFLQCVLSSTALWFESRDGILCVWIVEGAQNFCCTIDKYYVNS